MTADTPSPERQNAEALVQAIKSMAEHAYARGVAEGSLAGMTVRHARLIAALREIAGPPYVRSFKTLSRKVALAALQADGETP